MDANDELTGDTHEEGNKNPILCGKADFFIEIKSSFKAEKNIGEKEN